MSLILYAIPGFIVLLLIEAAWDRHKGTGYYRVNDTVTSLSAGILSRTKGFITRYLSWMTYPLLLNWLQVISLPVNAWTWVLAFVLYDFCYYWSHRFQHTINILWGVHVVHHSSEEYNLSTALRQTSTGFVFGSLFYIPLALLGIPLPVLITVGSLNIIYQFWVHTRYIPKLGWLEWIFVTPSNHRVHHAQNWVYIDKNFGGVFILWDRLFGTFQEELEDQPVVYGISNPVNSWNPFWANVHVYWQLISDAWHTRRWKDKIKVFFAPTGWRPADVQKSHPIKRRKLAEFKKFDSAPGAGVNLYVLGMFVLLLLYSVWYMLRSGDFNGVEALVYFLPFGLSFWNNTYLLSGHHWALHAEWIKWLLLALIPWLMPLLDQPALRVHSGVWLGLCAAGFFAAWALLARNRTRSEAARMHTHAMHPEANK